MTQSPAPQTISADGITCPGCHAFLPARQHVGDHGDIVCSGCGWRGQTYFYHPLPFTVEKAETALPDDAACVNHPTKKAVSVCAGTGDYICSLCAVEIAGQTFSLNYVNQHGQQALAAHFQQKLPRPDRFLRAFMLAGLISSCAMIGILFALVGPFMWWKMIKLRKTNPLYAKVITAGDITASGVLMLIALGLVIFIELAMLTT